MKLLLAGLLALLPLMAHAEDLGTLSANEVDPNFLPNPFGTGNPSDPNSVTNELGPYGNPYSPSSATNFEAITAPRLSEQEGNDRGRLSMNPVRSRSSEQSLRPVRQSLFHQTRSTTNLVQGIPTAPTAPPIPMGKVGASKGDSSLVWVEIRRRPMTGLTGLGWQIHNMLFQV